jgi:hypothetical protein
MAENLCLRFKRRHWSLEALQNVADVFLQAVSFFGWKMEHHQCQGRHAAHPRSNTTLLNSFSTGENHQELQY